MELIEAEKGDSKTLSELWHSLAEQMEPYSELNELKEESRETAEEGFNDILEEGQRKIFLIKKGGKTAGYISIEHDQHESRKISQYTKIVDLFVKKGYRGQGLGTETVEKIKDLALQKGSDYIKVSTEWENSRARKFYKGNGFWEKQVKFAQKL